MEPPATEIHSKPPELMTTREVAAYLRLKERRIYELVRQRAIPCTRVTGKWLFPRALIDLWLAENAEGAPVPREPRPAVIAGSHDPLLEWAVKESACALAMLPGGSLDGLVRFGQGQAVAAGLHLLDVESGTFNVEAVSSSFSHGDVALIEWARRRQGLLVAPGNPMRLRTLSDLAATKVRIASRQGEAGSHLLFARLLETHGVDPADLAFAEETARSEMDVGMAILEGRADAGLAIEAVARGLKLDFLALTEERYDLLVCRADFFEAPLQRLMNFARTRQFAERAGRMGGYDISQLGRVHFNAR